jgi:hypothetical protein
MRCGHWRLGNTTAEMNLSTGQFGRRAVTIAALSIGAAALVGTPWQTAKGSEPLVEAKIVDDDRLFWSFRPVERPPVPTADDGGWAANAIDRFILAKLHTVGLPPAPEAGRQALIRRVYFDLIGLPPTPEEVHTFLANSSATAYEELIDRLLASPHYGERWGAHWLDLARYAESDGHGGDAYRPEAWRYRDYVIRSLNEDKPYDQFVAEQLAGDEIAPDDPDARIATGFLRHWIYENNQRKVREVRQLILDDLTEVTGEVFLGLGLGCARCHDHKFDPIPQRDYYRLQAFFAAVLPRDDVPAATREQRDRHEAKRAPWEELTADLRRQIAQIEAPARRDEVTRAFKMFPQDIKDTYRKPPAEHSPLERQLVALVDRQLADAQDEIGSKLKDAAKAQWNELQRQLAALDHLKPEPLPMPMTVTDIGPVAPPTFVPGSEVAVEPGYPAVLAETLARVEPARGDEHTTGRRTALARGIASPDNPLTARVIVNRIWHYHFGRGLVGTPSDFGSLGERPTHPELLDWLAARFVEDAWSLKQMHRLIMASSTYRQTALVDSSQTAGERDPTNHSYWRMNVRRLDAGQIRDTILAVTGSLDRQLSGPSVDETTPRRTIYTKRMRNTPDPLLRAFDAPDGFTSAPHRDVTTTPAQALMLINGSWSLDQAAALADRLSQAGPLEDQMLVVAAYRLTLGRAPEAWEGQAAVEFLQRSAANISAGGSQLTDQQMRKHALIDLCHVLLNSNELIYVD